ncbi:MAG TPA: hypothetical protein VNM66_06840 [Thermodesulfobacteriota bacterium]|nr:hypothetical protein [Thermodesulfobacteriota bacterium]
MRRAGFRAATHITPPVILASERDVVLTLLAGARRFFVREVRLSPEQRQAIAPHWGWTPQEGFYRFCIGQDEAGRLVTSALFLTEYTIHGPVRGAVGLTPEAKERGAVVVELSEAGVHAMGQFYARIVASLVQRGAILYETAIGRGGTGG